VTLNSFKHFAHNKSSATLWLDPQSEGTSLRGSRPHPMTEPAWCSAAGCPPSSSIPLSRVPQHPSLCLNILVTPAELKQLQATLVRAFPSCTDLSADPERGIIGFTPHFSLGQWRSEKEAEAAAKV
jgi:2'-5' RNA ligase superfamily